MFAVIQRGDARDAETAQLAQRLGAQSLVEEDLDRSLLLARQAVAIDDSPQTRSYLLSELLRSPAAIGIMHGGGDDLRQIAVSPDGKTLAVGGIGADGLRFFDAETYEQIGEPVEVPAGSPARRRSRAWRTAPMGKRSRSASFDEDDRLPPAHDVKTRETAAEARHSPGCGVY